MQRLPVARLIRVRLKVWVRIASTQHLPILILFLILFLVLLLILVIFLILILFPLLRAYIKRLS